jgi:hypothetical protein
MHDGVTIACGESLYFHFSDNTINSFHQQPRRKIFRERCFQLLEHGIFSTCCAIRLSLIALEHHLRNAVYPATSSLANIGRRTIY